jgi:hypothetical protein
MAKDIEFEYGYDAQGIENLLTEIKGCVLTKAGGHAVEKLSIIKKACENNWKGESKDDFLVHLQKDAERFQAALSELYTAFEKEIANAGFNFSKFDQNLFK